MTKGVNKNFEIFNKTKANSSIDELAFANIKSAALGNEYELNLIIVGKDEIRKLNKSYRNMDEATDILSFPISEKEGEIFLCPEIALKKAPSFGRNYDNFMEFLFGLFEFYKYHLYMSRNIAIGIDIGTYQIKVVVASNNGENDNELPSIIGAGFAESKGMRHGYIINHADIIKSLKRAIAQAEKTSGMKIKKAYLSLGGIGLNGIVSHGSIIISKADSEITDLDVKNALVDAEGEIPKSFSSNKKIIQSIPISYKVDGKKILGRPIGMKGGKFEVKALFIMCF